MGLLPAIVKTRKARRFLEALTQTANVTAAAELAGVSRRALYKWRNANEDFARAWNEALELGLDALEDALMVRAKDGTTRPIYQQGKLVGHEQQFDNRAAEFILERRRPEVWGARLKVDVTVDIASRLAAARQKRLKVINDESS